MQNRVIKLSENDGVMYNEHEVWYVKKNKNNTYDKVSYFSKPNNAFL